MGTGYGMKTEYLPVISSTVEDVGIYRLDDLLLPAVPLDRPKTSRIDVEARSLLGARLDVPVRLVAFSFRRGYDNLETVRVSERLVRRVKVAYLRLEREERRFWVLPTHDSGCGRPCVSIEIPVDVRVQEEVRCVAEAGGNWQCADCQVLPEAMVDVAGRQDDRCALRGSLRWWCCCGLAEWRPCLCTGRVGEGRETSATPRRICFLRCAP